MVVGDDLHLDVAGPGEVALDVHVGPAEGGLRLASGGVDGVGDVAAALDHAHAAPATAVHGLHRDRPAELVAEGGDRVGVVGRHRDAGHDRHAGVRGGACGRRACRPSAR